jgi:ATP-binding cassette subfamily C (CFTR/MRP) protein 5
LSTSTEAVSQHENRLTKTDEFIPTADGRLTEEEMMEKGFIPVSTYKTYIKLAGGYMLSIFVISMFAVNVIGSGNDQNLKIICFKAYFYSSLLYLIAMSAWWLAHWLNVGVVVSNYLTEFAKL